MSLQCLDLLSLLTTRAFVLRKGKMHLSMQFSTVSAQELLFLLTKPFD